MRAGRLRHRLVLYEPSATIAQGDVTPTYTPKATVWGKAVGVGGSARDEITAEAQYDFEIRYRADVQPNWRVGFAGTSRRFDFLTPPVPDERRTMLTFRARELV